MDNSDTTENNEQLNNSEQEESQEELSHSDKMIGVFTEPGKTFDNVSKFPPRTKDWVLPLVILLALVAITQIILMQNSEIAFQAKQKQAAKVQEQLDEAVKNGQITQQQADQQMDAIIEQMDQSTSPVRLVIQTVSIFVVGFIIFLIIAAIHLMLSKLALKGEGTYASALVANGLAAYIGMIHVIIAAVLSLAFSRLLNDVNIATLIQAEKLSVVGFILGKLDVFSIWAFIVIGIGLSKMFKASSSTKYIVMVFCVWIIIDVIFYLLATVVPFLQFFIA
ncbi:MAG: YIP1 family protein [Ignavibacterium sp.]|nr:MAG: YIP1 family protein [Ignavibacterium sp.]